MSEIWSISSKPGSDPGLFVDPSIPMTFDLLSLPWLPAAPDDFKERCKTLAAGAGAGQAAASLATHRLSSSQALTFSRMLRRLGQSGADLSPLASLRLAILPSFTIDTIADMIPAGCARHGVAASVAIAEFDQIVQTAFDPDADRVGSCLRQLREGVGTQVIVSTVAVPPGTLFGSLDRAAAGAVRGHVERFNLGLVELAAAEGAILFDVAALAEQVGTAAWFDPVAWNLYKIPFSAACSGLFADWLGRLIGAMRGKSRKCLVLDCDNTLWGGVIGDDGIENILIGGGHAHGESFADVQRLALDLKSRGILLAICSKNDEANARLPFREHPDMLIRESDVAVFQANWVDKPSNLEAIARTLDIGLDSLVFLDDNSAERAQVRAALRMVAVPELPEDPAFYSLYLSSAGYFEALSFSDEDRKRSESYVANARRAELREQVRDLGDYLQALEMTVSLRPFDAIGRQRIVQLINKSNQFNLTTRRYTEAEVARIESDPGIFTLQVRMKDKYSDYGMIGVCIARPSEADEAAWDVDTWLMSCRVLGRKIENAMLNALVEGARGAGKRRIFAFYSKTAKNGMVADLFDRLGLKRIAETADGNRSYLLDVDDFRPEALPHAQAQA
jgi:FkbH-like protein